MSEVLQEFIVNDGDTYSEVIEFLKRNKATTFLLEGSVGLGKTTFVTEFLKVLAKENFVDFNSLNVMSPTYSIVNEYEFKDSYVYHADFYRIEENPLELEEVLESILESELAFIEWHEKMPSLKKELVECFTLLFEKEKKSRVIKILRG